MAVAVFVWNERASMWCDKRDMKEEPTYDTQMSGMLFSIATDDGCYQAVRHLRMASHDN